MIAQPLVLSLFFAASRRGGVEAAADMTHHRHLRGEKSVAASTESWDSKTSIRSLNNTVAITEGDTNLSQSNTVAASASDTNNMTTTSSTMDAMMNRTTTTASGNATDNAASTATTITVELPTRCINLLSATANENSILKNDNYYIFTDATSNGWYTANNITSYNDLPARNKFGFVTLACQCTSFGGRDNCCQGDRAGIDISGIDDPATLSETMQNYLLDICSVTEEMVGDNKLPPLVEFAAELNETKTMEPTVSVVPTLMPTDSPSDSSSDFPSVQSSTDVLAIDNNATADVNTTITTEITIEIPTRCLNLLSATANDNGMLKQESYYVFTDGYSNGWYSTNNISSFNDLPAENKFAFVTLSCQCSSVFGERDNCCQGSRAHLDVSGIDDVKSMTEEMQNYILDICTLTEETIGDNILPPFVEVPGGISTNEPTLSPTHSPSQSNVPTMIPTHSPSQSNVPTMIPTSLPTSKKPTLSPTNSPIQSNVPTMIPTPKQESAIIAPPGVGNGKDGNDGNADGGLGPGAWAGIVIAGVCVLALMVYLLQSGRRTKDEDDESHDDDNLGIFSRQNNGMRMLAITENGELGDPDVIEDNSIGHEDASMQDIDL